MLTQVAGWPVLDASAPLEISKTTVPRIASPATQPARNAGPLIRPRAVASIRTTAMIGTGLIATPTPNDRLWPIAWPMPPRCAPAG